MRVAVTGGAGFIGHHLVSALLGAGHSVSVLDDMSRANPERRALAGADIFHGDVSDPEVCREAFGGSDCVFHLAAESQVISSANAPERTFHSNVAGSWTVANEAARAGARHLIFASSREVYGNAASIPVSEDAPLKPHNLYGASKSAAETLLAHFRIPVSVLRLANVIGPGDSARVVPLWLARAAEGESLIVYGGSQVLDFVPVDFVVEAMLATMRIGPLESPLNVGSGVPVVLSDLAERIIGMTESSSQIELLPRRGVEVERYCTDTRRMCSTLGIVPPTDPIASIARWWNRS